MIYAFSTFTAFFLALLILTKKGRNVADAILGIWLIAIGLHFTLFYLFNFQDLYSYPHLLGTGIVFPFMHGPLLYLYTLALTQPEKLRKPHWVLHFGLPLFVILMFVPFYMISAEQKIAVFENEGKAYALQLWITRNLLIISGFYYVFFTHKLLQKHQKRVLEQFSNQAKINLNWLRFLFYGMAVIWVIIIFIQGDENIFPVATVFVFLMGYFGIKQVGIFTNSRFEMEEVKAEDTLPVPLSRKKYAKSGLSEEAVQQLHTRLTHLVHTQKPYLDPELTLSDLAEMLEVHANYLSQVINEMERVPFYDYINGLRVEEFLRRVQLPESQKYTLIALAYDCGFNSKTSFNRNFKKLTQLSPSAYLKDLDLALV